MVYGCDICQDVCPWNRGIEKRRREDAPANAATPTVSLREWLERDGDELVADFDRLYVPRNDPRWLRRNALYAAGNVGGPELVPVVERYAGERRRRTARRRGVGARAHGRALAHEQGREPRPARDPRPRGSESGRGAALRSPRPTGVPTASARRSLVCPRDRRVLGHRADRRRTRRSRRSSGAGRPRPARRRDAAAGGRLARRQRPRPRSSPTCQLSRPTRTAFGRRSTT